MIYRIADLNINIELKHRLTRCMCEPYKVDIPPQCADIDITLGDADYEYEKSKAPLLEDCVAEQLAVYRRLCTRAVEFDAFLLHSSVVELDGEAYMFTAPSGTGKSTHSALWVKHFGPERARIINDDKPIVRKKDGVFRVYGTPWSGKDNINVNTSAPVKAVCFIHRGEENRIQIKPKDSLTAPLLSQIHRCADENYMLRMLNIVAEFIGVIDFYDLFCTISDEAVAVAYDKMK